LLQSGDSLVFNDTKVVPARLFGKRPSGGAVEIFLVSQHRLENCWEVMIRPGRKMKVGGEVIIGDKLLATVRDLFVEKGTYLVEFQSDLPLYEAFALYGNIPLPQYIRKGISEERDKEDYQTIFAAAPGALAAPTAALHFTEEMLRELRARGVSFDMLTLHVGLGTFKPFTCEDIRDHLIHKEEVIISEAMAERLNARKAAAKAGSRQICVGTTCCRALENVFAKFGKIVPGSFTTDLFIYPGFSFQYVTSLLTNFHLPESSLLMLVSAFAGYDLTMRAYERAVKEQFRFFSYGDAMLIL
jgi:S-adenosylmethionine:tRNA ribosyltransferase-isomerase